MATTSAVSSLEINDAEYRKLIGKPIVKSTDMSKDMTIEVIDIIIYSVDKFQATKNYEVCININMKL